MSSHRNRREKVSSPSFLSWPPRCKVDPPLSGAPWATFLMAKWSTTLAERSNKSI